MHTLKKVAMGVIAAALVLVPAAPSAFAATITPDTLGVNYGAATGLGSSDVRTTISTIINVFLGLLGIVALIIMIAAGVIWMTSQGDSGKTETARNMMAAGAVGLLIILAAYSITRFIVNTAVNGTTQ